ncbi:hypothetical protein BD311DRAFT_772305 [Dichomitus squalens]|uniref:Uncharacterized protein n=1 Tax=Dichomitus squalens TaxID=114155 RepID=A0A4Q9M686_9APHY|nr:hypothetical protein BD311DRAFT_772305 [Dichomitus squalens]
MAGRGRCSRGSRRRGGSIGSVRLGLDRDVDAVFVCAAASVGTSFYRMFIQGARDPQEMPWMRLVECCSIFVGSSRTSTVTLSTLS